MDPISFLEAPLAPISASFEGERAPKKREFLVKVFQKLLKNAFLGVFFKILQRRRKFGQNRDRTALREFKNQYGRPKKGSTKILKVFWKSAPPPPRENPRSAPDHMQ